MGTESVVEKGLAEHGAASRLVSGIYLRSRITPYTILTRRYSLDTPANA
jgi:hypothetical protein